jgi:threonine/homoserine/homoserine lactone efflux protein
MKSMSVLTALLSFSAVAALLTIVPGLDTAVVLRAAIVRGRRYAFATALGVSCGTLIWGAAVAAGISALLTASHVAYTVLRAVGAIYLVWYGVSTLWQLWRNRHQPAPAAVLTDEFAPSALRAWARGLTTNLLNPKVGVIYVAMLPQFIPPGVPHLPMGLALAMIHNIEGMLWFTLLIHGVHIARAWLTRPSVKRAMEAITGSVLLAFGLELALNDAV